MTCPGGKQYTFKSHAEAEAMRVLNKWGDVEFYECELCKQYHMTTQKSGSGSTVRPRMRAFAIHPNAVPIANNPELFINQFVIVLDGKKFTFNHNYRDDKIDILDKVIVDRDKAIRNKRR